ncbi:hypothetical protein AQUCO_02000013v1 [Aquilegia coerulea]|uniref:Agglutinin domain-containing protein n=1 Tax=Aquilegia coerulea TaxID=218851 RepID=A0A2G5DFK2_AQUCA|nr:hypothetical protein AQUCO_02000013v1 [Aquilegia coerulea]
MAVALPRFVVLKSVCENKYLNFTNGEDDSLPVGFMKFNGVDIVSPFAKFELERAKSTVAKQKGWVHIRCCYNNKYWVKANGMLWVVAGAEEPEEDQYKPSCTLFKVEKNKSNVGFRHIQLGKFACLSRAGAQQFRGGMYLLSATLDKNLCLLYTPMNWENLVVFPKRVAFKGDNGRYLCSRIIDGYPYLQFAETARDETAEFEVTTIGNGCVRIKSLFSGKFWRRKPNWIWADSSDESGKDPNVLFWPVKISNNVVALRNMGNNYFCKRLTAEGKTSCLNAGTPSIASTAQLVMEELVISRKISHIDFQLPYARVYNEQLIALANGGATNEDYGTESKSFTLKLVYTEVKTTSWSNSVSFSLGAKTAIQISAVPLIAEGKIELSVDYTTSHEWGETHSTQQSVEASYTVTVPPRTRTNVSMVATRASCDVPFSYTQTDILSNGVPVTKILHDGVFTGGNYFNFDFKEKQVKLKM